MIVSGIFGMLVGGGVGAILGLISFVKKGRQTRSLVVLALNIALAVIPITVFEYQMHKPEKERQAAIEAQTPTERLFGLAKTAGLIDRTKEFTAFLEQGADINALSKDKNMTIFAAVIIFQNEPELVDFLVKHGADVNLPTAEGWTPLHVAASAGKINMIEQLLHHGADPGRLTKKNETAADIARERLSWVINTPGREFEQQKLKKIIFLLSKSRGQNDRPIVSRTLQNADNIQKEYRFGVGVKT